MVCLPCHCITSWWERPGTWIPNIAHGDKDLSKVTQCQTWNSQGKTGQDRSGSLTQWCVSQSTPSSCWACRPGWRSCVLEPPRRGRERHPAEVALASSGSRMMTDTCFHNTTTKKKAHIMHHWKWPTYDTDRKTRTETTTTNPYC